MEPILPTPTGMENAPGLQEAQGAPMVSSVESAPNTAPERAHEVSAVSVPSATTQVTSAQDQALTSSQQTPQQGATTPSDPQIADDVDVIEKEWVDKAKRIVSATKADPHKQEKEVSKLQADYLLKRYNKQVKLSE